VIKDVTAIAATNENGAGLCRRIELLRHHKKHFLGGAITRRNLAKPISITWRASAMSISAEYQKSMRAPGSEIALAGCTALPDGVH
jgi:hypothetical protein